MPTDIVMAAAVGAAVGTAISTGAWFGVRAAIPILYRRLAHIHHLHHDWHIYRSFAQDGQKYYELVCSGCGNRRTEKAR